MTILSAIGIALAACLLFCILVYCLHASKKAAREEAQERDRLTAERGARSQDMVVEALSERNNRLTHELRRLRKFAEHVRARERAVPLVYRIHGSGADESESMELVSPLPNAEEEDESLSETLRATPMRNTPTSMQALSATLLHAAAAAEIATATRGGTSSSTACSSQGSNSRALDGHTAAECHDQTTYTI